MRGKVATLSTKPHMCVKLVLTDIVKRLQVLHKRYRSGYGMKPCPMIRILKVDNVALTIFPLSRHFSITACF